LKVDDIKKCDECGEELTYCPKCDIYHHTDSFEVEHEDYKNQKIWGYCFKCGKPLTTDMKEDKDWFTIRQHHEAFSLCKECYEKED